jgi:hypothetical protein
MRKMRPPKIEGVKNLKNQIIECYKGQFSNIQKKSLYVALLLLKFKDDL